jgi:hypothetical protein
MTPSTRLTTILLCGLTLALAGAGSAAAAWTRFSPPAADSVSAPMGVARTADGTLHVLWIAGAGTTNESLMQTSFTPNGHLGATHTVSSGWSTLWPAGLAVSADGHTLNAFWGGIIQNDPNHQEFNYAYSSDGGSSWTLAPYDLVSGNQVGTTDPSSAVQLGGTFYQAWSGGLSTYVHAGITAAPANIFSASPTANDCCGNFGALAGDPISHQLRLAWYSNQNGYTGVYVQQVDPMSGQPVGSPSLMPGTVLANIANEGPQITARVGAPGFVVGYGTGLGGGTYARDTSTNGHAMLAWVVGRPHTTVLGSADDDVLEFTVAAGPGGRVWAVWAATIRGKLRVVVRRSNAAVTAWGSPVVLAPPKAGADLWTLSASDVGSALDVLAGSGAESKIAEYQTRVLAGLTLSGPARLARRRRQRVTFHVTDAGAPVRGARVSVGRVSGHTNRQGAVTLWLGAFGPHTQRVTAGATASGYTPAALVLRLH